MVIQPTGTVTAAAAAIAAGAVVVMPHPCIMLTVLVTITTTAAQPITFFDNAATGGGTVIGIVPGGTAAGTIFALNMPAINGVTIGINAALAAGSVTVSIC
jgi:hypothetical protein